MRGAALLVLVEAAALAALAGSMLVEVSAGGSQLVGPTVVMALMFIGIGLVLGLGARAVVAGRRWARGMLITWQLLMVAVGVSLVSVLVWWLSAMLVVLPVAIGAGLLVPAATDWFQRGAPPRG